MKSAILVCYFYLVVLKDRQSKLQKQQLSSIVTSSNAFLLSLHFHTRRHFIMLSLYVLQKNGQSGI